MLFEYVVSIPSSLDLDDAKDEAIKLDKFNRSG